MSLCLTITTPEGIVIAADSRQSYINQKRMSRIGSDSASKIFQLGKRVGVCTAGLAFLNEGGVNKNISRFIEEFKNTVNTEGLPIKEIAKELGEFFESKYQYKPIFDQTLAAAEQGIKQNGGEIINVDKQKDHIKIKFKNQAGIEQQGMVTIPNLQFIVSGYDGKSEHLSVFGVQVPGILQAKRDSDTKGKEYGADWIGQTDVLSRIVLGFDPRILNLPMSKQLIDTLGQEQCITQLRNLEYAIQWGTMTMQDAIDFSVLSIETTTAIQRFSDGIRGDPGDIPGVGGPVDVAIITPEEFRWIIRKNLIVHNVQVIKGLS